MSCIFQLMMMGFSEIVFYETRQLSARSLVSKPDHKITFFFLGKMQSCDFNDSVVPFGLMNDEMAKEEVFYLFQSRLVNH